MTPTTATPGAFAPAHTAAAACATPNSAACPECAARVPFARPPFRSEVVACPDCAAELEVTQASPITLALAPEVQEDWGE
jgi:alpha-aminoadipate carrier protein LysW